jgi:hypothetical protein
MQIREIILQTHLINELKEFYTITLELTLLKETETSFTVRAGSSELSFEKSQSDDKPFYHFAFNIPENQLQNAKRMDFSEKTELISLNGEDEFDFKAGMRIQFIFTILPAIYLSSLRVTDLRTQLKMILHLKVS